MNEQAFFERRRGDWSRVLELCDRADRSPVDLKSGELKELVILYRRVSTDLAIARTRSNNPSLIGYLNDLAARVYGIVYRQPRRSLGKIVVESITIAARTVRRRKVFVLASFLLFFGSGFLTYGFSVLNPAVPEYFMQGGMQSVVDQWKKPTFEERKGSESALMTGFYASNNPRTSIIAGSVGAATFGLLSIYMLVTNGAIIGVLASQLAPQGRVSHLLIWIAPHGVPELSGIIISGASGLLLGCALIAPGRRSRGDMLRSVGFDAIVLLATSVVMMFIAAPIEGFFSFNPRVPDWLKATVAIVSLAAWLVFWSNFGKSSEEAGHEQSAAS